PEIASRRHVELILPTIQEALDWARVTLDEIDCIGVINRPGLIGALIVGVAAAKSIAYSHRIPLVPVHHLEAHIYANWLASDGQPKDEGTAPETDGPDPVQFPVICLVVSGGHSDLILMSGHGDYEILARTVDDAAGEAFDKCARAMGLGYPGGPIIDRLAKTGNPHAVEFPRGKVGDSLDFSFSGLKTAVIRYVEGAGGRVPLPDLAASFQEAVVDVLVEHTFRAATERGVKQVLLAGGVAANSRLQAAMRGRARQLGVDLIAPPPILCTDNAAMAAAAAFFRFQQGDLAGLDLDCYATEALGSRA
ncbi:MAG: tRNA (adenosine(37)-N6)-threonylcarbamoyltransferase complex transferase subunit TsaD, partial [Armatimonadota bacterium]